MPLIATRGAASAQGFGEFAQRTGAYIEDVFSTYLYTGNSTSGGSQTIINNIDLSTKGGMVWIKARQAGVNNVLTDTARGAGTSSTASNAISSNTTDSQSFSGTAYDYLSAFNSNGFTVTQGSSVNRVANTNGNQYVSWTFRKQPKFFDVVTYTGNGVGGRLVSHNLGSTPGCVIVKRTNATENWGIFHRGDGTGNAWTSFSLNLTDTGAQSASQSVVTSTTVNVTAITGPGGTSPADFNVNNATYVMYLFAHNAGGFGASGADNVISCGSYTGNGSTTGPIITLGYEPQWLLVKRVSGAAANWFLFDTMRSFPTAGKTSLPQVPNLADTEGTFSTGLAPYPISTGFSINTNNANYNANGSVYLYIAIRRGPMKTPTTGTSVFSPITANAVAGTVQTTNFVVDSQWKAKRTTDTLNTSIDDRLREVSTTSTGSGSYLITSSNSVGEAFTSETTRLFNNTGFLIPAYYSSTSTIFYSFGRAPGFFDVVCYTGTGSARTVSHNLNVVPELMIVRDRTGAGSWPVYNSAGGNTSSLFLDSTNTYSTAIAYWNSTTPTSSVFSLAGGNPVNATGATYVAYLFATCPGVSKVGSYTGSGTTKQIDCGFTGGARFVLVKRTDSAGDWYVWDSARGIVAGNDPYLLFNSTAAEVTNTDYVDTYSAGFEISSTAPTGINANGGTYIFLAIA